MITYKARFNRIAKAELDLRTDAERLRLGAIALAMDLRGHRAAHKWGEHIGMLTAYKYEGTFGIYAGIVAAVITDGGSMITESHQTSTVGDTFEHRPCNAYGSSCSSYKLPSNGELVAVGNLVARPDDALSLAYGMHENLRNTINGYLLGIVDSPSDEREIARNVMYDAGHIFAHPAIGNFVGFALSEKV